MTNPPAADLLDSIRIASPCTADWNAMQGDDTKRFCGECKLHVHDLSAMTTDEALALLREAGKGRLCVRFHRRSDGRVLTQDCPKGLRRRLRAAWARAAALFAMLTASLGCARRVEPEGGGGANGAAGGAGASTTTTAPAPAPVEPMPLQGEVHVPEMGLVAPSPPQQSPQPPQPPQPQQAEQGRAAPLMGKPQIGGGR